MTAPVVSRPVLRIPFDALQLACWAVEQAAASGEFFKLGGRPFNVAHVVEGVWRHRPAPGLDEMHPGGVLLKEWRAVVGQVTFVDPEAPA